MFLLDLKGFIYTIAVYFYAFRLAFSSLFEMHFAAKRTAFSTISPCILQQNALRFAPYCTTFSSKTQYI